MNRWITRVLLPLAAVTPLCMAGERCNARWQTSHRCRLWPRSPPISKRRPREYGAIHWSTWGGEINHQRIVQEFDQLVANGIYVVNFGPGQRMNPKYLSPEHIALTKDCCRRSEETRHEGVACRRGQNYPSGFAGGKIGEEYPQLTMQGLDADIRIKVMPGQTLKMPDSSRHAGCLHGA